MVYFTMKYPPAPLTPFPPTFTRKIVCKRIAAAKNCERRPSVPLSTFRMNTCKSVSKQRTLSPSRMNTYEKPRGRGVRLGENAAGLRGLRPALQDEKLK